MNAVKESKATPMKNQTTVERLSEREMVITRTFNGPARIVFEAWTRPELFQRWWLPKSLGLSLLSYEAEVRAGGTYRLVFRHGDSEMAFFGRYVEVVPESRLVWTNEEGGADAVVTTIVTFEGRGGTTRVTVHELHPSKEALDVSSFSGVVEGTLEAFDQLEDLLVTLS